MSSNFDLKEQIRDYWSARAASFDDAFSHQVSEGVELEAWKALYARMLGAGEKHVLDLGCGTGEVSKILFASGHRVTGMDFSDSMLARARTKHADKGARAAYLSGDAEATNLPDEKFDAITCRHLVWTLLEPEQALADWYRVLKPGGHLVVFDGNFVRTSWNDNMLRKIIAFLDSRSSPSAVLPDSLQTQNEAIRAHLPYSDGFSFADLQELATKAGFTDIRRHSYTPIRRAQRKIAGRSDWLRSFTVDRFVLHGRKPLLRHRL